MSEESTPFPKSDTPARLLVVFAAALTNAPLLVETTILTSGYRFTDEAHSQLFGILGVTGLLLLVLLTAILSLTKSPTRRFAYKCLLATILLVIACIAIAPLRLD